jgi:putative transposase
MHGCLSVCLTNLNVNKFHIMWSGVWDITYIKTAEGWLFLAVVMDLYSRKIAGWSPARNIAVEMVKNALMMAIGRRALGPGLIFHSDRGI